MDWEKYESSAKTKENKIEFMVQWRTRSGVHGGRLKDWDNYTCIVELTDGSEVKIPRNCCSIVEIIYS